MYHTAVNSLPIYQGPRSEVEVASSCILGMMMMCVFALYFVALFCVSFILSYENVRSGEGAATTSGSDRCDGVYRRFFFFLFSHAKSAAVRILLL